MISGDGADYFFQGTMKVHYTAHNPDGDNVNPLKNNTYDDAENALNQLNFWEDL